MSMSPTGQPSRTTSANATGRETALRSAICCAGSIPTLMFVWVPPRDLRSVIPAGDRGGMAAAEVFTLIGLATVSLNMFERAGLWLLPEAAERRSREPPDGPVVLRLRAQ